MTTNAKQSTVIKMGEIKDTALVVRHNKLISSRHHLTLQENRLLLWLISQISNTDDRFTVYQIGTKELAKFIGIESNNIYTEMKKTTKQLLSRVVEISDDEKQECDQFQIMYKASYKDGIMRLQIHDEMQPFLLELKEKFTKVELKIAMRFSSVYALRVYDILKMNGFKGKQFTLEIGEVRHILGVEEGQYKKFADFRRWTLEPAQKEINKKTDLKVSYEYKKTGRTITHIVFNVSKNGHDVAYLPGSKNDKTVNRLEKIGLSTQKAAHLLEQYKGDLTRVTYHIGLLAQQIKDGKTIKNPAGWLLNAISKDYRPEKQNGDLFADEIKQEQEQKTREIKNRQIEISRLKFEIDGLRERQGELAIEYELYRNKAISAAIDTLPKNEVEQLTSEFMDIIEGQISKGFFKKDGWKSRLIAKPAATYLQAKGYLTDLLDVDQWRTSKGQKTEQRIEADILENAKQIKSLGGKI